MCRLTNVRHSCGHDGKRLQAPCAVELAYPGRCREPDAQGMRDVAEPCPACAGLGAAFRGATVDERVARLLDVVRDARALEVRTRVHRQALLLADPGAACRKAPNRP